MSVFTPTQLLGFAIAKAEEVSRIAGENIPAAEGAAGVALADISLTMAELACILGQLRDRVGGAS